MNNSTNAYLKGKVEVESILQFIKQQFDCNAMLSNKKRDYIATYFAKTIKNSKKFNDLGNNNFYIDTAFITFTYKEEPLLLFYMYNNYVLYENSNNCEQGGFAKSEKTFLSFDCTHIKQEIMMKIIKHYGGWIDFDDCDAIPYQEIQKDTEKTEKVRHVTMQEIYDKFGEVVVIDDFK